MSEENLPRTRDQKLMEKLMNSAIGSPVYLTHNRASDETLPNFSFAKHFNEDLARESTYFGALQKYMGCVNQHANAGLSQYEEERRCEREFKKVRLAAFDRELLYHSVNKKHFVKELAMFNNESAY
eukprot:403344123